jgi:hypothetical protein
MQPSKLNEEDMNYLNRSIMCNKAEAFIKISQQRKSRTGQVQS